VIDGDPIISFLLKEQVISSADVESLSERCRTDGGSLLALLRQEKLVDDAQVIRAVAAVNKLEFVNLSPEMIDPMVAHLIGHELANRHNAIPLKREGHRLIVAMSAPLDLPARDEIELKTGYRVVPVAATPRAVQQAIHCHFDVANVTKQAIASMRLTREAGQGDRNVPDGSLSLGDDPITKLVASIVRGAIEAHASDIHMEPQTTELRVRYRVDGMLRRAVDVPTSAQAEVISHIKILAQMDISEKRIPQDGHITLRHEGQEYDLRVSSLPSVGGEKIVLRILDKDAARWSLDEVVTCPEDNREFRALAANPYGMLLLTGPTGSGKTTTLYSVLQLVNTPQRNIVTVEDPVEYRLPGITQVQVRPVAGMTFASALRSILRQDPDVILIGEIRDLETAEIAVSAALTGHLVLSTLHTNDAPGAVSRLVNLGIPPFLVASALLGAVAQRLVRVICPRCRRAYDPGPPERDLCRSMGLGPMDHRQDADGTTDEGQEARDIGDARLFRGAGCPYCYKTGYRGRKAVYEILPVSETIRRMILDGAGDTRVKEQAVKEGMRTLRTAVLDEVARGVTTIEEMMRVVDIKSE